MDLHISPTAEAMGRQAADAGASFIRAALRARGHANLILATGASQFTMLAALLHQPDLAWHRVTLFHLDEYFHLPPIHPASFRKYLWDRFVKQLPVPLAAAHWIDGEADPHQECARLGTVIRQHPIDVAFVGIGENGHLAFNDPPADFETEDPFIVVQLDDACRRQQLGEGWFPNLDAVPQRAISMSIRQIMKSHAIICTVPEERKAIAVENTVRGPVSSSVPASILQRHGRVFLYLDEKSSSRLTPQRT
jgi:glucosamine-6-phosphate deaminase